jgi:hypothetical protein
MSENINEKKKMFPPKKMTPKQAKEYKKFIGYAKMGVEYQIDMSLFESVNEDGHTDVASAKRKAMLVVDDANKLLNKLNGMNKEDSLPSWLSDKITIAQTNLSKSSDYLNNPVESVNESKFYVYTNDGDKTKNRKIVKKDLSQLSAKRLYSKLIKTNKYQEVGYKKMNEESVKESMNPSAVKKMRAEFEKTGELPPHLKKFAKDLNTMKKKHKVKNIVVPGLEWMSDIKEQSVNEARLDPQQLLQQLGGNRFIMMVGAKNLVVDKSKNELHMKIGRNAKGVSHVRIRLSSMDLYDMEFLQVRAGKIKIKSKEKGVYADQLGKMFKKNTGMNVRL